MSGHRNWREIRAERINTPDAEAKVKALADQIRSNQVSDGVLVQYIRKPNRWVAISSHEAGKGHVVTESRRMPGDPIGCVVAVKVGDTIQYGWSLYHTTKDGWAKGDTFSKKMARQIAEGRARSGKWTWRASGSGRVIGLYGPDGTNGIEPVPHPAPEVVSDLIYDSFKAKAEKYFAPKDSKVTSP